MEKTRQKKLKLPIRRGDQVKVLAGKYKREQGIVLTILPQKYRAIVEGVHNVVKHVKPSAKNPKGTIVHKEASIHISNLMLVDPTTGEPTRVGRRYNEAGKLQRYGKKSGNFIKNG